MDLNFYLHDILIFLSAAIVVVSIIRRLLKSPVLGYLLAGVLVGPYGFHLIDGVEYAKHIAEFGVVFLLFNIGLEVPWERLVTLKRYVFGLGVAQVCITTLAIGLICYWVLNLDLDASIIIGATLSLSSTAVVVQVLAEKGDLAARYGRVSFSVLLLQDLAVVLFLVLINLLNQTEGEFTTSIILSTLAWSILKGVGVLVVIGIVGRGFIRPVYRLVAGNKNPELFVAMTLLIILVTGYATGFAGLSMELGAFMAGLLLAETEYRHQVEADIYPFRGLLLGLFFMSVGMEVDLGLLRDQYGLILGILSIFLVGKACVLVLLCKVFRLWWSTSLRVALLLAGGGEFAFVLLAPAMKGDIVSVEIAHILSLTVAISMSLTPFFSYLGRTLSKRIDPPGARNNVHFAQEDTRDLKSHVVIVGFGRIGQIVAKLLADQMIPYVAIDMNMGRVSEGRRQGLPVYFGDARRSEIFKAVGIDKARAIVLTIDQPGTISRTVITLKRNCPNIPIFVRARDVDHAHKLEKAGAIVIVPEILEPSLQIASAVMVLCGISKEQITKSVSSLRHTLWERNEFSDVQNFLKEGEANPEILSKGS